MMTEMATTKKKSTRAPAKAPERRKSKLTQIGEEAQRAALLKELKRHDWVLKDVAEAMDLNGTPNLLRAIKQLGLTEEYEAAKADGKITAGRRPAS